MHITFSLTVSESKRLIGKGVARADFVRRAAEEGILAIGSGTTNGYVVEEITGEYFDKKNYVTGRTLPSNYNGPQLTYTHPDLVIRRGERLDVSCSDILPEMGPGDVYSKGANAINYERNQAAVLIGHPTGGGVGGALGTLIASRVRYLHPVGLEKSVNGDLDAAAASMNRDAQGKGPTLWVVPGELFTEIEALKVLADVDALPISSGGIGGAEGAVWLAAFGEAKALDRTREILETVRGEPPFTEA